uniref:hypothetical protein n=1 Tax=Nocardia carnea TaxID=37328 RepID=UPI002455020D
MGRGAAAGGRIHPGGGGGGRARARTELAQLYPNRRAPQVRMLPLKFERTELLEQARARGIECGATK